MRYDHLPGYAALFFTTDTKDVAMKIGLIVALTSAIALVGCVEQRKDIYALDGSRADGLLDVAFQGGANYDAGDINKALEIAAQKCKAWGYKGADKFGSRRTVCLASGLFGCLNSEQTVKCQCLGSPDRGLYGSVSSTGYQTVPSPAAASKEAQLEQLSSQNLPYEEYQRRYKAIAGQRD